MINWFKVATFVKPVLKNLESHNETFINYSNIQRVWWEKFMKNIWIFEKCELLFLKNTIKCNYEGGQVKYIKEWGQQKVEFLK